MTQVAQVPQVTPVSVPALQTIYLPNDKTRINGLYLAPSQLLKYEKGKRTGTPIGEYGLFTSNDIEAGEFIIFYTGAFFTNANWQRLKADDSAMHTRFEQYSVYSGPLLDHERVYLAAPVRTTHVAEDLQRFPAAAINEPSARKKGRANVFAWTISNFEVNEHGETAKVLGFPLCACRTIKAGEELTWNYGPGYASHRAAKNYQAGRACGEQDPGFENEEKLTAQFDRVRDIWENTTDTPRALSKYNVLFKLEDEDGRDSHNTEQESQQALGLEYYTPHDDSSDSDS